MGRTDDPGKRRAAHRKNPPQAMKADLDRDKPFDEQVEFRILGQVKGRRQAHEMETKFTEDLGALKTKTGEGGGYNKFKGDPFRSRKGFFMMQAMKKKASK